MRFAAMRLRQHWNGGNGVWRIFEKFGQGPGRALVHVPHFDGLGTLGTHPGHQCIRNPESICAICILLLAILGLYYIY